MCRIHGKFVPVNLRPALIIISFTLMNFDIIYAGLFSNNGITVFESGAVLEGQIERKKVNVQN